MTAICEKLKVGLDTRKIIISGLKKKQKKQRTEKTDRKRNQKNKLDN